MNTLTKYAMSRQNMHGKTMFLSRFLTLITMVTMLAWSNSAWAEFKDFHLVLAKGEADCLVTEAEFATQYTPVEFGYVVNADGTVSRVAKDDPTSMGTIKGKSHSEHGITNFEMTVNVDGGVKVSMGTCNWGGDVKINGTTAFNTNNAGKCWHNDKVNNMAYGHYVGGAGTITISGGAYTAYVSVEAETVTTHRVSFSLGDVVCEGNALPVASDIVDGQSFTIPANFSLYKEGYTLTGWTDGVNTYNVKTNFTPTADVTLKPVFTQNTNNLGDRTEAVTMIWDFQTKNGAPTIAAEGAGKTGIWVTQAIVNGETIDVKLDYNAERGKLNNTGSSDWCQINKGTILTFPSCQGATVTAFVMSNATTTTIGGTVPTMSGNNASVTISSSDATQQLNVAPTGDNGDIGYIRTLTVVLPYVAPAPTGTDIFTMSNPTAPTAIFNARSGSDVTATYTGGSGYVFNGHDTNQANMISNGTIAITNSGNSYFKITLDDKVIEEGDIISVDVDGNNTLTEKAYFISTSATKGSNQYSSVYTVTYSSDLKGARELYFWRGDAKKAIYSVTITRPSREGTHQVSTVIDPAGTGKITIDKDKSIFSRNTAIVLTAVPNPNFSFVNWTNSETGEVTENPYNYTTTGSDVTITANFQEDASYTTVWDFKTMASASAIERAKGTLDSNGGKSGTLNIDATNGKFQLRGKDAQFNANTIVQVPVNAPGDLVTVNSSTNALTVAGVQALGATTYYTVSESDMAKGYVDVVSTNGNYLYDITVKHTSPTDLATQTPTIKEDVVSTECAVKDETVALSFSVENADKFQWYENTSATNSGGTAINGATNSTYKPTQSSPTTKYYYCVATNSKNDGVDPVASSAATVTWAAVPTASAPYDMKVGNAAQLLYALKQATGSARYKIFLADGDYNLGDKTLNVVKSNVSLIGQSKAGVIIRNKPRKESINGTAVFLVTGSNVVMQDLTIKCEIEESARTQNDNGGYDERGVCIQDDGTGNVYRNIRLLGRQDTYYSRQTAVKSYFENCEIHGTVDFICGDGDVWFEGCDLMIENMDGAGDYAYITAPSTKSPAGGYVFNNCTISNADGANMAGKYYLGRAWQQTPKCYFYNTTKNIAYAGAWGEDMTSVSNKTMEEHNEASSSTPAATIGASVTASAPLAAPRLIANTLTWAPVDGAVGYAIYRSGVFLQTTTETSIEITVPAGAKGINGKPMTLEAEASLYSVASISSEGVIGQAANAPISNEAPTITTNLKENYKAFVGIQTTLDFVAAGASEYQWYISNTNGDASTIAIEANKIDGAISNSYIYTPTIAGKYYLCCKTTNIYGNTFTRVAEVSVGEAPQDITLTWPMVDGSGNLYKSATSSVDGIVNLSDAVVDGTIVKWNESKQNYSYTDGGTGYYGQVTMISGPSADNSTVNVNAYVKYSFTVKNGRTFILKGISGLLGRNGTDAGCAQLVVKKGSDVLGQTSISQPNRAGKSQPSTTFSTSISDVTCVENDVIDLYVYWGGTGTDKSYGLKDITITGKYTKEADTASPTIDTDVLDTPYAGMPDSEVNIAIAASHYTNIQWYKNTTNSNTGGTKVGDGKATLVYTPTSAEHGQTLYFYAVVSNDDAVGNKEIKSAVATVNVGARSACDLLEVILTNGFDAFIKESAQGNTVESYYMSGADKPTIKSYQVSPGATYSLNGNMITVTAEDGTVKTFTFSCESVEPLTDNALQTITSERPSWLKGGCYEGGTKETHEIYRNVEQADNKRITEGKNRVYLFLGPSQVVNLVSNNEACGKYTTDKSGTYAVNGGERQNITLPKATGEISIPCEEHGNVMVEIRNLDTSSSWGFNTVQLSNLLTVSFKAGAGSVGTAPADVTVPSTNGRVAIPANTTLYKQGYTLTGWTDSSANHYDLGKTYTFTENTDLQAEWRKNVEDFTDYPSGKVISWKLCTKDGGPSIAKEGANCFVQQERIIEETNDIALNVAMIKNRDDSWITGFDNAKFGTYLVNGSKISFDVYYKGSYTLKVDDEHKQTYDFAANGDNNHCEYTYTGKSGWVEFSIAGTYINDEGVTADRGSWFFKEFKTSYPSKGPSDLAVVGEGKITLDPSVASTYTITATTDYTTSGTGAMHYSSSDDNVVTVSDGGVITAHAGGDAVVTVRQEGDASHAVGTIKFNVHVKAPVTVKFIDADGTEHSVQAYTGERLGAVVPTYDKSVDGGKRFHGWFTSTDGNGDRASEVYVVKKATDFHAYFMDKPQEENGFIMVPVDGANDKLKGDALLNAIEYANEQAAGGTRKMVFIPNGTYDLGTQVLSIVGSNVSLIGESMEGVIIQSAPYEEGLDNTATFKVTGDNVVMQNLTIKNRVEEAQDGTQYPQGVCIEDAGANNVYREVRLLGRQNTYYASDAKVRSYFENSEIHGTVDIVRGDGNVWFEGCKMLIEPANVAYIAAPATTTAPSGFIFNGCTIASASTSMASKYYLGRGYTAGAKAAFHNTTKTIAYKETGWGKNIVAGGTFVESAAAPSASVSTVVTNYTNDNKLNAPTNVVLNKETFTLTWNMVANAHAYIIYKDGKRIAMVSATADATQSYVIPQAQQAKGIKARSMTTAAAIEGGYSVASVSQTGIIGDAKAEAQIPAITKDLTATAVYVGKAQTFAIEATDATDYQWYKSNNRGSYLVVAVPGNVIAGATNASYSYTATEEGTVYLVCKATNAQGDAYSTVIPVTAQNPVITQNLNDKYGAVVNTPKTINIVAEGGATYQWYMFENENENEDENYNEAAHAISGATSSMLTQTWAAVGTHYIYCKVNGVVNSAVTTVTVAATAEGGSKTYHAGTVYETYDFASLVAGGAPNLSLGSTSVSQASGTNPLPVYVIDNPKGTVSNQTLDLNGRFAVNNKYNSGEQLRWMWRSSTNAYQNGLAGNWNNKGTAVTSFNMSILGLYAGDKVTINYSMQSGKSAQLHVVANDQIEGLTATGVINSKQTYTIAEAMGTAGTAHLDLYCTNNNMAIQSITIESHYYATSEPQISTNLPADVNAYKDVPRVLSVAASDADSYQWYKATSAEASAMEAATPIEGANEAAYVYTPTAAGNEYYFCVVSNANGAVASAITTVTTVEADVKTFDFLNWDENDKALVMSNTKTAHKGSNGSINYDIFTLDYPRDLRGYMAIQNANIAIADAGLKVVSGSGNRVAILTDLAVGDVVTFIGTGMNGNVGVESGANGNATCNVMTTGEVKSIQMTSAGDLNFWLDRYGYGVIKQIIVTRKTTPVFTQNLNEKYFVTTGGDLTLTVAADNANTYQWYSNTHASNMGGEAISGATTASYTPATSADGTGYYYCVATNTTNNTVAVSNVAQVDVANVVFRDFELDIRQKRDYGLTEAEAVKDQAVDFGVNVDEDGTLTRVAETANVNVRVQGTYESTVLGLKNAAFIVPVQGKIKFSIGKTGNDDKAKDYGDVTVKDAAGNTVATLSTKGGKWSSNKKNVIYGYYTGPSTTLTFTTSTYVPYIRVEKVEVAELNAPAIRQTSFDVVKGQWAVTMATNADADGARIYYTTDGTDPTVGSTLYSGTAYVAPNTTIKAMAVCEGWYDSGIGTLTTDAQPATKGTEVISYHNGETGDNIGMTYTVTASYNAGQPAEGDGLKMHLTDVHNEGDNAYTVNGFRINVNNGYRITGINLNDVNITRTAIRVDGVVYEGALDALNATQTIDFVCEGLTPIDTKITLSYEFADDVTGITVNGVALTAEQVEQFKNKTLSIDTQYKGAPEVVVTTALGYTYTVDVPAGDGTTYTYGFTKVGDCQITFTNVLKALPVITFNESKFYFANPDGAAERGKGYNFTVSGEAGGTYTITIDGGDPQTYDSSKKYYAIETATVQYSSTLDASYPKDEVTAHVASTNFDTAKPFAIYLYAGGYTDQNMEPKPLEAKMILDGIGETYNVVLKNKGELKLVNANEKDKTGTNELDNLGKADLIVLSEAMSSSEALFQTFDYKNGTTTTKVAKQLGLGTTNVLNFKIFAAKSSVWNWAEPAAVDTKTISIIPSNPLYSVFNGVHFNDDANHTIDIWNDNHAPLLNHLQGVWNYVEGSKGPEFFNLATAQSSATSTLDVLQYRYATPLADAVTPVADNNKVFVNFGLNINDYSAYDENVKAIVGNICRMINDHTPLNSIATSLTKPVITDNGDGSAKIMTSTSMATIKYVTYDAAQSPAPTAEYIKTNGKEAVNGMTIQFATNKVIYAIALMDGMSDSPVSDAFTVTGSPLRKITRRALPEDDVVGVEVTQIVSRSNELKVPYNQTYKKEGYTVTSWIDQHTGATYYPGEDLTLDQDLDLVAQWTKNTKSVTDLCGGPNEQRTATFNLLMKDGAPEMKLDGNFSGVLVGQVKFSNNRGDFIDVVAELSGRETMNPQSGRADAGKLQNNFTNSWNWLSGDGTQIKEYCQIKTGTVFTFPAVNGMTVNFKATDLERDEEASHQVQVHRSYLGSSQLTDGTLTNPAYTVDVAGNYILTHDNFAEGADFSYNGQTSKAELVVIESSMVYERPSVDYDKNKIFEDFEPGWNANSVFMEKLSVTYPALYKVTPTLDPAISEIVADGSTPTAEITYSPAPAKNAGGKFTQGTAVKMIVTPTYAYRYDTTRQPSVTGVTITTSGADVPEDGAVYSFTMGTADKALDVPMEKIPTRTIKSSAMPLDAGRIVYDPDYTSFADGKKITLTAVPKVGYEFMGWSTYDKVDFDNKTEIRQRLITTTGDYVVKDRTLELTVNPTTENYTYYAHFKLGNQGTVNYKLANAVLLNADGTTEKGNYTLTEAEKNGFPTSMTKYAMIIPTYYTMYKEGYTLDHWLACDADGNTLQDDEGNDIVYNIGTYYYFDSENEVRNIKPVFKKNKTKFEYRTTEVDITWDFRTAYFAQSMNFGTGKSDIHYSTHSTINREKDGTGIVTMDVPVVLSTGEYGKVNNQTLDEWATLGEGTTVQIPSGLGATFTLASYAPITSTKIDDDVLKSYTVRKENGVDVYIYTYKTKSPKTYVTLTIGDDFGYYKYIRAQLPSAEHVDVNTSVNVTYMGTAEVTSAGTIPNGDDRDVLDNSAAYPDSQLKDGRNYYTAPLGSYVTFVAKRNRLYEFDKWVDGNGKEIVPVAGKVIINTDNNVKAGEATSTLIMQIEEYLTNVKAVFKERSQYQINYTAGKLASGIAPAVQVIEKGESFTLPKHNQVLYYEGHTLKYWLDEEGKRYDFGQTYTPLSNLYLSPVFEPNEFAFSDILNDVTMTWPLAVADGATDINFRGSSGIIVDQMEYEGMKIDMKLDIKSSSTSYRAYNNTNDAYCLITDGINIELPSTPGCKITLNSYSENVTRTEIAGATSDVAGANTVDKYAAGISPTVIIKQDNTQGAQTISFKGDSPSFTSISVTYTAINGVSLPELTEVTIGGVAIGTGKYSNYSIVDLNSDKVLNNIPVEIVDDKMPEVVVTKTSNSKESNGKWSTSDEITYIQATVDNPTATIILKSAHGIIAGVYKLNLKPQKITGSPTLEKVNIFRQDREGVDGVYVVPGTVAPNSMVTLTFNRAMAAKTITADDIIVDTDVQTGEFHGTISAPEGKDLKFSYWNLDLGKTYRFTVKANTLKDIYGNYYDKPLTFQFTISDKLIQQPEHRAYDFVVTHRETFDHSLGKDKANQIIMAKTQVVTDELIANLEAAGIPHGTIDEAIAAANAQEASAKAEDSNNTKRTFFRIFVPDGEYQIGGNAPFDPGRDFSDNKDGKVITKDKVNKDKDNFPYNNGETFLTRPRTSIIGQSQDKTVVFSDPYFYGISYTSTIEVRPHVTDCYFQDLTLDNRYSWYQMRSGAKPGGQCAAFYDRGQRTILKNVGVLGYQDSYVSDASNYAQGKSRCYYETSTFAGTVDFLCGDGDMWWEQCTFLMRYRASNNFIAPRQSTDTKWGYVFNDCTIDAENEAKTHAYQEVWNSYQDTYEINNGNYHLGRPWENSPYITLLNTQMILQPNPEGWMNMKDAGLVLRFHELGSTAADGSPIDLSTRTTRLSTPGPGSFDVVMTPAEAASYKLQDVIGGDEGYDPKVYTAQMPAVAPGFDDTELSWRGITDALLYAIFKSDTENGEYKLFAITTGTVYDCGETPGWYKVRAANQRGGLGEWSKAVQYVQAEKYELVLNHTKSGASECRDNYNNPVGWSTICLPFNAKVPVVDVDGNPVAENFKVYAATKIQDNLIVLKRVHYTTAGIGYVVYGYPGRYVFKGSGHYAEEYDGYESLLNGNPTDENILAAGTNCYTLSYKPNVAGIGFYKYTGTYLNSKKAYLTVDVFNEENEKNASGSLGDAQNAAAKKGIRFIFEEFDDPTGIYDGIVEADNDVPVIIYDLQGRRLRNEDMVPGNVYIINGKAIRLPLSR